MPWATASRAAASSAASSAIRCRVVIASHATVMAVSAITAPASASIRMKEPSRLGRYQIRPSRNGSSKRATTRQAA